MGIIDHIQLLDHIHHSIVNKRTGSPKDFAARLNISESTLNRIIEELKDRGADIAYSRIRSTYYYRNEVEIRLMLRIGTSDKSIKGGNASIYSVPLSNLTVKYLNFTFDSY